MPIQSAANPPILRGLRSRPGTRPPPQPQKHKNHTYFSPKTLTISNLTRKSNKSKKIANPIFLG